MITLWKTKVYEQYDNMLSYSNKKYDYFYEMYDIKNVIMQSKQWYLVNETAWKK